LKLVWIKRKEEKITVYQLQPSPKRKEKKKKKRKKLTKESRSEVPN